MPDPAADTRSDDLLLAISLRLKAARYLAGSRSADGNRAIAMSVDALAQHELLIANGITKNKLEDYEQMVVTQPRPMELEVIADALGVPRDLLLEPFEAQVTSAMFGAGKSAAAVLRGRTGEELVDQLTALARDIQELLNQQGRRIGKRDLERRHAADRTRPDQAASA